MHELFASDPERADSLFRDGLLRDARPGIASRRRFVGAASAALLGAIPYARFFPGGMVPAALAQSDAEFEIPGKDGRLILLNDRPINAETPAHLLDDAVTPADRMFVRNNGTPPIVDLDDIDNWALTIDGEACVTPRTFTLGELGREFEQHTLQLQLECAGNGRSEFLPPASGNQWSIGAVACPEWTGVRLRDVLERCGIAPGAVYVAFHGADRHLSGDPNLEPISRGVPMHKALEDESLIAWAMNGAPLPALHGYPLRLVFGGWPGSVSGKWLQGVSIRDRVHDGEKMLGQSYRVPCESVAPGTEVADDDMCIIESMPVKSLVTSPRSGIEHAIAEPLPIRGHAWAGDLAVERVQTSIDFGQTWIDANVTPPANRLAWQHWDATLRFPARGYFEVWARATDTLGRAQPMVLPAWNPRGYLNNACHRIAVQVA